VEIRIDVFWNIVQDKAFNEKQNENVFFILKSRDFFGFFLSKIGWIYAMLSQF